MRPRTRVYTDSSGTSELLLCIYGKLGIDSSLPVIIWLPKSYPIEHPLIYVDFESAAELPPAYEQYVTANGEIHLPFLQQWDIDENNVSQIIEELVKLERNASAVASVADEVSSLSISPSPRPISETPGPVLPPKPPRPPRPPQLPLPTVSSGSDSSPLPPKIPVKESSIGKERPKNTPPEVPQRPPVYSADLLDSELGANQDQRHKEVLADLQKTLNELSLRDAQDVQQNIEPRKLAIASAVKQFGSTLGYEKASLQRTLDAIKDTKAVLSRETEIIEQHSAQVCEYEELYGETPDPSSLVTTESELVDQLYRLVAKDCALTDTIHTLGRLLNSGVIKLDTFVKKTRALAREQFLVRVHMQKVIIILEGQ